MQRDIMARHDHIFSTQPLAYLNLEQLRDIFECRNPRCTAITNLFSLIWLSLLLLPLLSHLGCDSIDISGTSFNCPLSCWEFWDMSKLLQGLANPRGPGSENIRIKGCVFLPAAGRRTQLFHIIFTEPGPCGLAYAYPCTPKYWS